MLRPWGSDTMSVMAWQILGVLLVSLPARPLGTFALDDDTSCLAESLLQVDLDVKALEGHASQFLPAFFNRSATSWLETVSRRSGNGAEQHRSYGLGGVTFDVIQASMAVGFVTLLLLTLCFICGHSYVAGAAFRRGIEAYDKTLFGVHVKVGTVEVNLISGHIFVGDLVLLNPPGYTMPCLLKARNIFIDVSVYDLIANWRSSRVADTQIDMVRIYGLEVFHETKGWGLNMTSNSTEVYNNLFQNDVAQVSSQVLKSPHDQLSQEVLLHELFLEKITVQYKSNFLSKQAGMAPLSMELPPITVDDFGKNHGPLAVEQVVHKVLGSVLLAVTNHIAKTAIRDMSGGVC